MALGRLVEEAEAGLERKIAASAVRSIHAKETNARASDGGGRGGGGTGDEGKNPNNGGGGCGGGEVRVPSRSAAAAAAALPEVRPRHMTPVNNHRYVELTHELKPSPLWLQTIK